jgi:hypothetical protein
MLGRIEKRTAGSGNLVQTEERCPTRHIVGSRHIVALGTSWVVESPHRAVSSSPCGGVNSWLVQWYGRLSDDGTGASEAADGV